MVVNEHGALILAAGTGETVVTKAVVEKDDAKYPKGDQANYDLRKARERLDILTEGEFAMLANVKLQTLQSWRTDKIGPSYIKVAKTIFYKMEHIDQWFACNTIETNRTLTGSE